MKKIKVDAKIYDVIIVGGGPAGLFAAYYLGEHSDLNVLLIEKGKSISRRNCPISEEQGCVKCKPCNILCGVGGAGLFSDGKLNYIHKLGKTDLTQFMPQPKAETLIEETEAIYNRFGMDGPVYPTDMAAAKRIRKQAKQYGIDLLIIRQKHLGSDCLPGHIEGLAKAIKSQGISIHTSEEVKEVVVKNGAVSGILTNRKRYKARNVILAPGRVGADWVGNLATQHGIGLGRSDAHVLYQRRRLCGLGKLRQLCVRERPCLFESKITQHQLCFFIQGGVNRAGDGQPGIW